MPTLFLYLLKLSIGLAVVYLFYQLVLRRLTFYRYNRWYLLAYPMVCFIIPLIDVAPLLQQSPKATVLQWVPVLHQTVGTIQADGFNGWQLAAWILALGSLVMLGRLAMQYLSLLQIKKQASPLHSQGITVYQVNKNIMPFSFANGIYVNRHNHSPEELQEIIRHEYVHVQQRHSLDILLSELLCIINWYNPFAWLLRHAIRQNLEFIADNSVVESGIDKKAYQYLLLKVVGEPQFRIANQFNFSSLKKRITMMNKIKSTKVHLLKFLIALPLVAVLLLAFRQQFAKKPQLPVSALPQVVDDTIPQPSAAATPYATEDGKGLKNVMKDFTKRHPSVKSIQFHTKVPETGQAAAAMDYVPVLYLTLTNGAKETYVLNDERDVALFKEKYGELPPPAPPVAPAPPAPPASETPAPPPVPAVVPDGEPTPAVAPMPAPAAIPSPAAAPTPPPVVKLPKNVKDININNNKATVTLKNGTTEDYDLNNNEDKKAFEGKYGSVVPPTPAPPARAPQKEVANAKYRLQWAPPIVKKPAPGEGC